MHPFFFVLLEYIEDFAAGSFSPSAVGLLESTFTPRRVASEPGAMWKDASSLPDLMMQVQVELCVQIEARGNASDEDDSSRATYRSQAGGAA